ncbi:MAG: sigma-70 family RNA polymerase sigma factor [Planctomycetota bacterium]|jgi:RNA polymerase sigma-70 factor (subfamily 1)|nr:sigma-70 family RNA polymerase sigma factor [Planctomycetota bacterium]MDP6519606.1 sigma-70 family RNA polymerase sigma factor [Planctomycetota bacterium]MDP6955447.1 sigma-70 family RNA polymerase sigma factor [Planctomycetota bacterium]
MTSASDKPQDARDTGSFKLPQGFADENTQMLVDRAQAGEVEALNELFTRYHQSLVELARRRLGPRLRSKEDPVDLAQTTFREATRDFNKFEYRGEASLLRWLIQILQNKIRDKAEFYSAGKRDMTRERNLDGDPNDNSGVARIPEPPSPDLSVTMHVQKEESFEILRGALEELTPDHRKAITLVFFQGLTLRAAGERMGGKSEDAVRMMLRRAEDKLGGILRKSTGLDSAP